jgi:hypothetical protein
MTGITRRGKDTAVAAIEKVNAHQALKLVAELKVILLADEGGGLNEQSRTRAWRMVHEIGQLLIKEIEP